MIGLKASLAAFALVGAIALPAQAQGVVPGGWSAQFDYQPLGSSSFVGGSGFGTGATAYGGYGSYPTDGVSYGGFGPSSSLGAMPGLQPGYSNNNFLGLSPGMPQTSIDTDPLLGAIHKSVRRSKRR